MEARTDFEALQVDEEALVFFQVRQATTRVLARKHFFGTEVQPAWQATWNGDRIPADWTPYAFITPTTPDPALLEDDYS